jgi:hypothetical protein
MDRSKLPVIRSHERMDYARCPKKWYWAWRRGLTPRAKTFGALELGTWWHEALAKWYTFPIKVRREPLSLQGEFVAVSQLDISSAERTGAPEHQIEKAQELAALGEDMTAAYERHYKGDPDVHVIRAELPLEFSITDENDTLVAMHRLKPDLIYQDANRDVWLMEHKTAAQIRLEHLVIDGQARPYGAMAEPAMRKLGLIKSGAQFRGIMYNFARKALSDERPRDSEGRALNKNGTVSARQPAINFVRHLVTLSRAAKLQTLKRIRAETHMLTLLTLSIRAGNIDPAVIPKTPHSSCPKTCQFFGMCVQEENGGDTRTMEETMYVVRDPYAYDEDSTDEPPGFEMG